MGIGGIESSVAAGGVRSLNTRTTAPEVTSVQAVTPVPDNYVKVAKTTESDSQGGYNPNEKTQEQLNQEGVPIQEVSKEKVESALRDINSKIKPTRTECQFSYHEETKRISIKVMDQDTGEVIREIPPEKTLDMIAKSLELAGILVDEKR